MERPCDQDDRDEDGEPLVPTQEHAGFLAPWLTWGVTRCDSSTYRLWFRFPLSVLGHVWVSLSLGELATSPGHVLADVEVAEQSRIENAPGMDDSGRGAKMP